MSYRVTATWTEPAALGLYTSNWEPDTQTPLITRAEVLATCATLRDAEASARHLRAQRPNQQIEVSDTDEHHRHTHQRSEAADQAMARAKAAFARPTGDHPTVDHNNPTAD